MNSRAPLRWDIFCRVIDNFGDIGVTWRLARQLAAEYGRIVRLWVDDLSRLHALCPGADATKAWQVVDGVEVFQMSEESGFERPADAVIEAFGCGLPENYVAAMATRGVKPRWIILEYLSAEPWVREHHGRPSPHPKLNIARTFFFPGFVEGTGGLLREADLLKRREAFDAQAMRNKQAFWQRMNLPAPRPDALCVSLFAYPHAPVQALLEAIACGATPVVAVIPEGPVARQARDGFGASRDRLEVRYVPFVSQTEYDALLWACDINFVRGEDSFVRAQWAARPFVWHIYPQAENAHVAKLNAFLDCYGAMLPPPAAQAVRGLWGAWNVVAGAPPLDAAWAAFAAEREGQRLGLRRWVEALAGVGDLAGKLLQMR